MPAISGKVSRLLLALDRNLLIQKSHGLHAGNLETLTATQVFARYQVVAAHHVGTGLGELGAVTLVGASRKLALLGADEPAQVIFGGLMAMRAVEGRLASFLLLIVQIALVHHVLRAGCRPNPAHHIRTQLQPCCEVLSYGVVAESAVLKFSHYQL